MLRTTLFGRCPACGAGPLFRGWLQLADTCDTCGVRFDRYAGNWLGPTILAYGVGAAATVVTGLLVVPRHGFFSGLTSLLALVAATTALAAIRPIKAWWIWLMWRTGFVQRDELADSD
jgi:uncharacterized protein (DUF983 family)